MFLSAEQSFNKNYLDCILLSLFDEKCFKEGKVAQNNLICACVIEQDNQVFVWIDLVVAWCQSNIKLLSDRAQLQWFSSVCSISNWQSCAVSAHFQCSAINFIKKCLWAPALLSWPVSCLLDNVSSYHWSAKCILTRMTSQKWSATCAVYSAVSAKVGS